MEGNVSSRPNVTPVFWFHYTPDILDVEQQSPINLGRLPQGGQGRPGRTPPRGSGLNSANHAAHRANGPGVLDQDGYVPYKGTGDLSLAVLGGHIDGAMTYRPFAIADKGKVAAGGGDRAAPSAAARRADLQGAGVDWVDGAYAASACQASLGRAAKNAAPLFTTLIRPGDGGSLPRPRW